MPSLLISIIRHFDKALYKFRFKNFSYYIPSVFICGLLFEIFNLFILFSCCLWLYYTTDDVDL